MKSVAAVVAWTGTPSRVLASLQHCDEMDAMAVVVPGEADGPSGDHRTINASSLWSSSAIDDSLRWFQDTGAEYLLWTLSASPQLCMRGLRRLIDCVRDTRAAIVYSDYFDQAIDDSTRLHPLVDYQVGSLRDDFDFGQLLLIDGNRLRAIMAAQTRQHDADCDFGGWYDLRLRLSEVGPIVHLPEPTYVLPSEGRTDAADTHFCYVDPRNRDYQREMERIATAHLRRIGGYLEPPRAPLAIDQAFPVEASVVIPVRNRERTVAEAVQSALSQRTDFPFNVIVVDNHSSDGTSQILAEAADRDQRLIPMSPTRCDLGIGGCWNEAIYSERCGRYAVQLDSDDLYSGADVLQRIVDLFHREDCAMVIGSYTIVDFDLRPIPPGLVDHREWTDENGHNNALRIAGLGAPRAFHVSTLREIGFPNVSYGEDYAVALRMAGKYRIGRIYESLYWCRRWEDNTDHDLALETSNRYAVYKDRVRTMEIAARRNRRA